MVSNHHPVPSALVVLYGGVGGVALSVVGVFVSLQMGALTANVSFFSAIGVIGSIIGGVLGGVIGSAAGAAVVVVRRSRAAARRRTVAFLWCSICISTIAAAFYAQSFGYIGDTDLSGVGLSLALGAIGGFGITAVGFAGKPR